MEQGKHRRSIRLKEYDYTQTTGYFVTICTAGKLPVFGSFVGDEVQLNREGRIVRDEWLRTTTLRTNVTLDEFIIMPDHIHGIIMLTEGGRGTACCAPTTRQQRRFKDKCNTAQYNQSSIRSDDIRFIVKYNALVQISGIAANQPLPQYTRSASLATELL